MAPLKEAQALVKSQAEQLKNAADQLKEANQQIKNAANNAAQAQLNLIKKTVEETGALLLNPFKPLIDFVNEHIPNIKWIKEKLEGIGWGIIAVAGLVLGFLVGFPFWVFIRKITPKGKAA